MKGYFWGILIGVLLLAVPVYPQRVNVEKLEKQVDEISDYFERVDKLNLLGSYYLNVDPVKFEECCNKALSLGARIDYKEGMAVTYNLMGNRYRDRGDNTMALWYTQKALEIYQEEYNPLGLAQTYNNLAVIYNALGNFSKGLEFNEKSLEISKELGHPTLIGLNEVNIGFAMKMLGHYDKAMDHYLEAYRRFEQVNNLARMATVLNNIGGIYTRIEEPEEAIKRFRQAYDMNKDLGIKAQQAICLYNIGTNLIKLDSLESGQENLSEALIIYKELGMPKRQAQAMLLLGEIANRKKNWKKAEEWAQKALSLLTFIDDKQGPLDVYLALGRMYNFRKEYSKAKSYFLKGLKLAEEFNLPHFYRALSLEMARVSKDQGNYKAAFNYLETYRMLNDSLLGESKVKQVKELEFVYQTEKKEQQLTVQQAKLAEREAIIEKERLRQRSLLVAFILLLFFTGLIFHSQHVLRVKNKVIKKQEELVNEKNELLEKQTVELMESNSTKDKLLSIIGHDLRNSVGNLKYFVETCVEDENFISGEDFHKFMRLFENSTNSAYSLLENLLYWARSQQNRISSKPTSWCFQEAIEEVQQMFDKVARDKTINLNFQGTFEYEVFADSDMAHLVLRNLVSNALKFTPKSGVVSVWVEKRDDFLHVYVKDTGVGMSKEVQDIVLNPNQHYTTRGTNKEKGSGLGLNLVKDFVTKNGGILTLLSEIGNGSEFCFTIPTTSHEVVEDTRISSLGSNLE